MVAQTSTEPPKAPPENTPTVPLNPNTAVVLYVNPTTGNDQDTAGRTEATPYRTITYALQQAAPGTAIQLAPGTYAKESGEIFPLVLKPSVIVRGSEGDKGANILIRGGGTIISKAFARQDVAILAAQGSEVRGVTVTNPNTRGTGVWVEDVTSTIANNTFTNSVREGVFATGNANPTVTDNVFTKNQGNGISITKASTGQVKNNSFVETGYGLAINGTSTPLIEGNQISQNRTGLVIGDSARPVLRNNAIMDSGEDGIVILSSAQPNLGTAESNGNNTIRNSKKLDVNNTTSNVILAIGNSIDRKKIAGRVEYVASNIAFGDVQGHWAQQYIQALAARNIITGFPDGTFKPNDPVTRVQFAAIVLKAFAPGAKKPATEFTDVNSKYWGYTAIQTAARGGFMAGYPGGTFRPEQRIPKVQALVALANGLEYGAGDTSVLKVYQDASTIPSYANGPLSAATQRQIVVNYPTVTQLNPNREATRAEVAAFIYQALVSSGKAQAIPSPYIVGAR
jgi:parallel beta-helix repeat protein